MSPEHYIPISSPAAVVRPYTDSTKVMQLSVNADMCSGYNSDRNSGDDGIAVLLEPRDIHGKIMRVPGRVSIVLLDPQMQGEGARMGRWDFSVGDVEQAIHAEPADGIILRALWQHIIPTHRDLQVFVRYTTQDGRRIELNRKIAIAMPGEPSARWTRVPAERREYGSPR